MLLGMKRKRYLDAELLEGIYNRDSRVVKHIMDLVWQPVKEYVLANSGDKQEAMNLIQEGILSIYSRQEKPQLSCSFTTYFYSICKNMWLNELRRKKKVSEVVMEFDSMIQENEIAEKQLYEKRRQLYLRYFSQVGKVCQDVLRLMSKGFSNEDITVELAFSSVQYTKNRKSTCNKRLIELIKNDPEYKELKYGL